MGEIKILFSPEDAESLGLDDGFDNPPLPDPEDPPPATPNPRVVAYQHIKDFYETAGRGSELHVMLVKNSTVDGNYNDEEGSLAVSVLTKIVDKENNTFAKK